MASLYRPGSHLYGLCGFRRIDAAGLEHGTIFCACLRRAAGDYSGDGYPCLDRAGVRAGSVTVSLRFAGPMLRCHWLLGPAATAATLTLVELFIWHVIPVFGMAQCFARVTSAVPATIQFAAYAGLGGVVFALVFSQSLLASLLSYVRERDPDRFKKCTASCCLSR